MTVIYVTVAETRCITTVLGNAQRQAVASAPRAASISLPSPPNAVPDMTQPVRSVADRVRLSTPTMVTFPGIAEAG